MATDTEAGRAQPQTTIEAPGGPFIRYSQQGRRPMYQQTGTAFGNLVNNPLVSVPGYTRLIRFRCAVSGGINSATTSFTAAADAPYNIEALVQLRDAFGTPLFTGDGYSILNLVPLFSGGYGLLGAASNANMPSWVAIPTGGSTLTLQASFAFSTALPLEFARGYGVISMANASLLPTLLIQTNPTSTVWSAGTFSTAPTIEHDIDVDFYWLPEGVQVAPPGLGSTRQWVVQQGNPTVAGSSSTTTVVMPRLGGFIDTFIFVLRDSTNARIDQWPSRARFYLDGVPVIDSRLDEWYDDIYNVFGGITRPTGVLALSRKTSLSQIDLGLLDTYETAISTNPGTLVQLEGSPWGSSSSNTPWVLTIIAGQVVPSGTLIQGLPEI